MSPLATVARLHRMDAATWERHASPWSVWTRVPILPLGVAVLYFRQELGGWIWAALGALVLWAWFNPRAFPPPRATTSWASRAVLGERVWLNRAVVPLPAHAGRFVPAAIGLGVSGLPLLAWGLWRLDPAATLLGLALSLAGKFWFLDRMVRLYGRMRDHPAYRNWAR